MSDQSAQDPGGSQGPTRHTPARTVSETFSDGGNDTEREVDIGRASRERQLSQASSSAEQSLSTTPTQSAITGAPKSLLSQHPHGTGVGPSARPAEQEAAWARPNSPTMERVKNVRHEEFAGHSARESSQATSMGGSQSGTIGRGAAPRAPLSVAGGRIASSASGRPRDASLSQRTVSYAPSDMDSTSGFSASEYSSGGEESENPPSRPPGSASRSRPLDAAHKGTQIGRGNLLVGGTSVGKAPSGMSTGSNTAGSSVRRSSDIGARVERDGSRVRRARERPEDLNEDGRYGIFDEEDDEVEPHDRGEELVRRRMKIRQREKALRRKKEKEAERQKLAQAGQEGTKSANKPAAHESNALGSPRIRPTGAVLSGALSPGTQLDRESRPTHISLPTQTSFIGPDDIGAVSPLSATGATPNPGPRGAGSYPSPHGHIRRPSTQAAGTVSRRYSDMSGVSHSAQSTARGQGQDVFLDNVRSGWEAPSSAGGSTAAGDEDEDHLDEERDQVADLVADPAAARAEDVPDAEGRGFAGRAGEDEEVLGELQDEDHVEDEGEVEGSPSPDEGSEGDVEYTLKDRQDAINIEHPFGLPIWKPALYKKSRSVTRNAETALHLIPSAAAERHLLPGNILWTILFGSWLSLVCFLTALVLKFMPLGGDRYARVAWELGGYLFWPFGKYVEAEVSHESGERGVSDSAYGYPDEDEEDESYENAFTPVAARFPHDHAHRVPFNSRPTRPHSLAQSVEQDTLRPGDARAFLTSGEEEATEHRRAESNSSGTGEAQQSNTTARASEVASSQTSHHNSENSPLKGKGKAASYGAIGGERGKSEGQQRTNAERGVYEYVIDENGNDIGLRRRLVGRVAFGILFWLVIAPLMGVVCLFCWGMVFTIPMAKLTWVLLKNLAAQPLALHFRSAPGIENPSADAGKDNASGTARKLLRPLRPGQPAPRSHSFRAEAGAHRRSKILLCTYRAVGLQYYKYTVGGVNILFVNLVPLVFFVILDFFFLAPYVERHNIGGLPATLSGKGFIFLMSLASVIPLSYFIGMAVASISAQSSIGMGAVINATFGSIIEIILYAIALTQEKAPLVEGSIIGSILAGVLLMPGLSMCSGATRRKEQRFNARSAGVTSTMLIMAIIGILTPTLFYQIYGTFQLTCQGCPSNFTPGTGEDWTCKRCFYEHVPPATDPFYQDNVKGLMYTCTVILVLSYGIGLWFSLRTHASQIWQNPQPAHHAHPTQAPVTTAPSVTNIPSAHRASIYKRLVPASVIQQLLPTTQGRQAGQKPGSTTPPPTLRAHRGADGARASESSEPPPLQLPENFSHEDFSRAVALTASAFHSAMQQEQQDGAVAHQQQQQQQQHSQGDGTLVAHSANQAIPRSAEPRHVSVHEGAGEGEEEAHGGHDAPSWSRLTSMSVLLGCTVLYAVIAEILVDVVDVVLEGSGIDEKFLGITLFALVPNTTEFMNAMSFAINGNIALSMEIGSAYALQVCLIQIPAMVAFSAYYNSSHDLGPGVDLIHRSFTLIFPRWDVIAIIFSVFLLTYTYIEARSNYYRGSICLLSYCVLVAGFFFAPNTGDSEMPEEGPRSFPTVAGAFAGAPLPGFEFATTTFGGLQMPGSAPALPHLELVLAAVRSLWAR